MAKINYTIFLFFISFTTVYGQSQDRYVVYFSDKSDTPYSIESPGEFLSERSLTRREVQGILVTEQDLPVNPLYLEMVREVTDDTYYPSKWLNAALIQCTEEDAMEVLAMDIVIQVDKVASGALLPEGGRKKNKFEAVGSTLELNDFQLELHGIPELHEQGYKGEGMLVAIMDGGFSGVESVEALQHVFNEGRVLMSENIALRSPEHFGISHGTNVMSIMAGELSGQYRGIIPNAEFLLFDSEDPTSEQRIEEYNWIIAAEKADSAGADVINSSLGYSDFDGTEWDYTYADMDGGTTLISRGADWAAERGMLVVTSAGNEGNSDWKFITAPADAHNVLAVGAVDEALEPALFSSFGPSADGRIKPDVSSLGVQTVLIRSDGVIAAGNGTSFSAPIISGFATVLWQRNRTMTAEELRDYIISISSLIEGPENQRGYGIPSLANIVTSTADMNEQILVYPNPVKQGTELQINSSVQINDVQLISVDGRSMSVEIRREGSSVFIATNHPAGMYILRIESSDGVHSVKIISN